MSEQRKISMKLNAAGRGDIEIDGRRIPHLSGFKVDARAGDLMRVELDFALVHMDLDAPAMVHIAPETTAALTALGWTPPADKPGPHDAGSVRPFVASLGRGLAGHNLTEIESAYLVRVVKTRTRPE